MTKEQITLQKDQLAHSKANDACGWLFGFTSIGLLFTLFVYMTWCSHDSHLAQLRVSCTDANCGCLDCKCPDCQCKGKGICK